MTLYIGVGHYSRTGKDTFANYLVNVVREHYPNKRIIKRSFAWKLKEICHDLYGWAGVETPEYYDTDIGAKARGVVLPAINMTPVQLWVAFGTLAVRNNVYAQTWVDYLLNKDHGCDILVIPDMRFANEVSAIQDRGGICVKVVRPGYGPMNTPADRALINFRGWDYVIGSSGALDELEQWAVDIASYADANSWVLQTKSDMEKALSVERR